ncbi:hypothetical protein [Nocardia sp. XZ_19_385]|uniref:hypothetical protein n=1 Tax=Nocardia sp. XZ_19_385 TaxID=2769488 RepID=UPI0028166BCD|nr:hypothetical protein [Nocardia sp. XZ_19_385]
MERARLKSPVRQRNTQRDRRASLSGLAVAGAFLLAGCDSVAGIPGDEPGPVVSQAHTTPPAAIPAPVTPTLAPPPADAPPVGAVPGVPEAAPALQRWAADLSSKTLAELQDKCWIIPPRSAQEMYADEATILEALAKPGTATKNTVTWKSADATVTAERDAVTSGYACPRVFPAGAQVGYDDADARHTVRRYLSRFVGSPLDPADKEGDYPLLCNANPASWDPNGTGKPIPAPLFNNSGRLTGTTKFADQQIGSERLRGDYIAVTVPVTNSSGATQTRTFTLVEQPEGYCIGDVSG